MRTIKYTTRFKRDYKREKSGRFGKTLDGLLMEVVALLATDTVLPRRNFDHPLAGEWSDHRDCHVRPNLSSTATDPHLPKTRRQQPGTRAPRLAQRTGLLMIDRRKRRRGCTPEEPRALTRVLTNLSASWNRAPLQAYVSLCAILKRRALNFHCSPSFS